MFKLPISESTLKLLFDTEAFNLNVLSYAEVSAVFVLTSLTEVPFNINSIQKKLVVFINQLKELSSEQLLSVCKQMFESKMIQDRFVLIENDITLMSDNEIESGEYLDDEGYWIWQSPTEETSQLCIVNPHIGRYTSSARFFTPAQSRNLSIIINNEMDNFHINGYAGTGKTHLIETIVEKFSKKRVLLLANRYGQLESVLRRVSTRVYSEYFYKLVDKIVRKKRISPELARAFEKDQPLPLSHKETAHLLGIQSIGSMTPVKVLVAVLRTVSTFCFTDDSTINLKHLSRASAFLSKEEQNQIIQWASIYWEVLFADHDISRQLHIWNYHKIKKASLYDEVLIEGFDVIIVDEAHFLSPPQLAILQRSHCSVITLGDDYQALKSNYKAHVFNESVRKGVLSESVRVGDNTSKLFNGILSHHPIEQIEPFRGSPFKRSKLIQYEKFRIPSKVTTILVVHALSALSLAHQLHQKGAKYYISRGVVNEIKKYFNQGLVDLFHRRGLCRHPQVVNCTTWNKFLKTLPSVVGEPITQMLSGGFDSDKLEALFCTAEKSPLGVYSLARIDDVQNMSFESITIYDDLFVSGSYMDRDLAKITSMIYTALSRHRSEAILPGYVLDWLHDIEIEAKRKSISMP